MKYYRILFLAAALTGLASCAKDMVKEFPVDKPQDIAQYEYLNDYDVLKNYVDRAASPDFKLGAALSASDFNAKSQVYVLAASNFDEMTAGNAMKYASVVDSKGNMNFDTVRDFVNNAEAAGMTMEAARQLGMKTSMLVSAIFPMIGIVVVLVIIRYFKKANGNKEKI
jgi:hypothetical protein